MISRSIVKYSRRSEELEIQPMKEGQGVTLVDPFDPEDQNLNFKTPAAIQNYRRPFKLAPSVE